MINDILLSIFTLLLILLSSFALYFPLRMLVKDKDYALKYAIPFSISVEIVVGYIFYCTDVKYFPLVYLIIVVLANLVALYKLRPLKIDKPPSIRIFSLFVLVFISAVLLYTRFFEAFKFIGPGGNDAGYHVSFVRELFRIGFLSNGYYAPGFHLFVMPLAKIIPLSDLYRFVGPSIGITTIIALVLLLKDYLKNKTSILVFLSLMLFPIYNQLALQTITFFSSSLSFIQLGAFMALLTDADQKQKKISLLLTGLFCLALAFNIPYFFIALIPAIFLLCITVLIFRKVFTKNYPKYLLTVLVISVLGLFVSFAHVVIQSNLLKRYYGFPNVKVTVDKQNAEFAHVEAGQAYVPSGDLVVKLKLPKFVKENIFLKPALGMAIDFFNIKEIRPLNSILGLGGYLMIGFSIFLLWFSIRKKNSFLFIIAVSGIAFGVYTQTGLFEMSYYKGRSGWYLLLLSLIGIVVFLDDVVPLKLKNWILAGCVLVGATGIFFPPKFYRSYYEAEFVKIREIAKRYPDKNITVLSTNRTLAIVGENLTAIKLSEKYLDFIENDNVLIVIEKAIFRSDPILARNVVSTDKDFEEYNKRFESKKTQLEAYANRIISGESFKANYKTMFENKDFSIYGNLEEK